MPHKVMASQLLVVRLRKVGVAIGISKGEVVALRLSGVPFHGVLRSDGVEVLRGLDNVLLDWVVADGEGSADVAFPPGLGETLGAVTGFGDVWAFSIDCGIDHCSALRCQLRVIRRLSGRSHSIGVAMLRLKVAKAAASLEMCIFEDLMW